MLWHSSVLSLHKIYKNKNLMPIITLTTEWNKDDYYIGAVKGLIMAECPKVTILDISHQIASYSYVQAAFIIRSCYKNFPPGTIHMICARSDSESNYPYIVIEKDLQYFITANNGIADIIFDDSSLRVVNIGIFEDQSVFPELHVFARAAAFLANGNKIEELGEEITNKTRPFLSLPLVENNRLIGKVIYIDSYRNAITNISRTLFEEKRKGRQFEILAGSANNKSRKISRKYNDQSEGELVTLFNSIDLLEIAIAKAPASELLALEINSEIKVFFK